MTQNLIDIKRIHELQGELVEWMEVRKTTTGGPHDSEYIAAFRATAEMLSIRMTQESALRMLTRAMNMEPK